MEGAQTLTAQMDVYAFAICCWEILNMGALPWPYMDDSAVRHFVLSGYPFLHYSPFPCVFLVVMVSLLHLPGCLTR